MKYQISRAGRVIGEFSLEDIMHGLKEGSLVDSDYYWMDGMTDWQLLSDLPKPTTEKWYAKFVKAATVPALLGIIIAAALFGYDLQTKYINARNVEARQARLASLSRRLAEIQTELAKCEIFLRDFEVVGKGHPDPFDSSKPVSSGFYISRSPDAKRKENAFNAEGPTNDGRAPRFRVFAIVKGDGEIRTYVRSATLGKIWRGYAILDQHVECELSVDGNVQKVSYDLNETDNGDSWRKPKSYVNHFDIPPESLAPLVKKLRENRTPKAMMRVGGETADLEFDAKILLEYFKLSEAVKLRSKLTEEKGGLDREISDLKKTTDANAETG